MKILIIHKANSNLEGDVLLHLVYENMGAAFHNDSLEIELLSLGVSLDENIFYSPDAFKKIHRPTSLFYFIKNRKTVDYDLLINLSTDFMPLIYDLWVKAKRKKRVSKSLSKKLKEISVAEREKILAEKILHDLVNSDNVLASLQSNLNLKNDKLAKTSELINWILESTNHKPLKAFRYIYMHVKIDKGSPSSGEVISLLKELIEGRNIKIIVILENDSFYDQTKKKLLSIPTSTNQSPFILDFLSYKDFYFWLVFAGEAVCTITNNSLLELVCNINEWPLISSQKETLTKTDINDLNKRLKYYLKHNEASFNTKSLLN